MITDRLDRPLGSLRISVTDRCNLRCQYCMPAAHYTWLPRESLLSTDEIVRLAGVFVRLGVRKLRLTGGEPLLRRDIVTLVERLRRIAGVEDLALTTNGTRLAALATPLRSAGLGRLTVSLDTLDADALRQLTRHGGLDDVLLGLDAAAGAGFTGIKLNTVVMRGINDAQVTELVRFAIARGIEPRFIEYMDVGGAREWQPGLVVSGAELLERLSAAFGAATAISGAGDPSAPARRWRFGDSIVVGLVNSTTAPFCGSCDRARLTADGTWYRCLYAEAGTDLQASLRTGASDADLSGLIREGWESRQDRGAEDRLAVASRGALVSVGRLTADPRLEMHVRGG